MSKVTTISLKPFQQKSYLVPKIKAKPSDVIADEQHLFVAERSSSIAEIVPPSAPETETTAPSGKRPMKRKADAEKPEFVKDETHAGATEKAPCTGRSTRSKSAEPQPLAAPAGPSLPPDAPSPTVGQGRKRSRAAPAGTTAPDLSPAPPAAVENRDVSTFVDGNEIFRWEILEQPRFFGAAHNVLYGPNSSGT